MRILLFSSHSGDAIAQEALVLHEVRGYDVLCFHELAHRDYRHNDGHAPSPREQKRQMVCELLEGRMLVIHPDSDPADVFELVYTCACIGVPRIRLHQLPERAEQCTEEVIASLRSENDITTLHQIWTRPQPPFDIMQHEERREIARPALERAKALFRRALFQRRRARPRPYAEATMGVTSTG